LAGMILGDRYELMDKIGEGGMSIVYKARCRILDRIVAVKVLKEEFAQDDNFVQRFKTEALAAASLSHPNLVNIYDVGQQDECYYIVMEYVQGQTLKELIEQEAPLSIEKAVDIAIMICDGLHHAHEKGIIHRDIKPHNVLITESGMVKVADFGIAQAITKQTITFGGNVVGSVHYISPEQAKGEPLTRATDIYSVGCVLYEMVTGKIPYDAESPITVALKHIHDDIPAIRSINSEVPVGLEGIIIKAMEKLPQHRFSTAEELRNALLNIHSQYFSTYTSQHKNGKTLIMAPVSEGRDRELAKKKLRPAAAIAILAVLGLFLGVLYQLSGSFFGEEVEVPYIVGMSLKEADRELSKVGLKLDVLSEQYHDEVEKDHIISQQYVKGFKVKKGREIGVVVSLGIKMQKVPNVVGMDRSAAEVELRNHGFRIGETDKIHDEKYKENQVISQDPRAGTEAKPGEYITLMISEGPAPQRIKMPNLIGMNLDEARKTLQDNNLDTGQIAKKESDDYYVDQVIDQDTKAGVLVDEKTTINLTVSSGPGPAPQIQSIELQLPGEQDFYKVVIKVTDARGQREVYDQMHNGGDRVIVGVSYFGTAQADIFLNGKHYRTVNI
jgi:beta-lactam-binding protein with PASTA domain/tRNA A-37 threonylcarbamoyl transferase component Bud32